MAGATPTAAEPPAAIERWTAPAPAAAPIALARRKASAVNFTDEKYTAGGYYQVVPEEGRRETPEDREAWVAAERVPEARTLVQGTANLASAVRFYVGFETYENGLLVRKPLRDKDGRPANGFTEKFVADCEDALARYSDGAGRQSSLIRSLTECLQVVGRARLVGYHYNTIQNRPTDADVDGVDVIERWVVVAPGSVWRETVGGKLGWRLQVSRAASWFLPRATVKEFTWPSSRYPDEGSGWVLACLDVFRDLRAFSMANRAAARSGIPADLFIIPTEASPAALPTATPGWGPGADGPPDEAQSAADDWAVKVEGLIGEFVMEVLADADSGNAAIPGVLSVESRWVQFFQKVSFSRPIDRGIAELSRDARERIAEAADAPPEMLRGLGKTNRWNGVQIADDEYRRWFRPKVEAEADGWTEVCFWPEMRGRGYRAELYKRVRVLADPSDIISKPDYSKIAPVALDRGAIGPAGFRHLLNIPESCAPTEAELAWMEKMRGKATPSAGPGQGDGGAPTDQQPVDEQRINERPDEPRPTAGPVPSALASSTDDLVALADTLHGIEVRCRGRLEEACEAAIDAAFNQAGAKLRNWARSAGGDLRSAVDGGVGQRGAAVVAALGRAEALKLASDQEPDDDKRRELLFAAALATLLIAWRRIAIDTWTTATGALGSRATGSVPIAEVEAAIDRSADVLEASMLLLVDDLLFGDGTVNGPVGETTNLRVPGSVIRRVMAAAGGDTQVGAGLTALVESTLGLVFGPLLARVSPETRGLRWVYGDEPRQRPFEPHEALDNQVFTSPQDELLRGSVFSHSAFWHPGDHNGCRCDWVPVYRGS